MTIGTFADFNSTLSRLTINFIFLQLTGMTVSVSTSGSRSRASEAGPPVTGKKSDKLNAGLPQLNKARKMEFKKMKKQRKKRGRQHFTQCIH